MNDEIRKQLMKLINNPGMFNPEDMEVAQDEDLGENFKVEEPESEFPVDEELAPAAEAIAAKSDANMAELPTNKYQEDTDITKMLRKLKNGEDMNSLEDVDVSPEVIDDPMADVDLRKAAMEKVKSKYLGR